MKIDRLIGILSILLQEEKTTAPELAERFEVSRRTINRDIEDLCKAGIPIKTAQGTGGGISIMDGYRMDRTILSSKDMQMILAGLRSLDSVSGSRYYSQLMEKIQTGSSEFISGRDSMLIDLSSWYKDSLAPKIEVIQSAIENRRHKHALADVIISLFFSFSSLYCPFSMVLIIASSSFFCELTSFSSSAASESPTKYSGSPFKHSKSLCALRLEMIPTEAPYHSCHEDSLV